jgi:hypothetical protein
VSPSARAAIFDLSPFHLACLGEKVGDTSEEMNGENETGQTFDLSLTQDLQLACPLQLALQYLTCPLSISVPFHLACLGAWGQVRYLIFAYRPQTFDQFDLSPVCVAGQTHSADTPRVGDRSDI